eukprot:8452660-Pyramimonas_sp.AAC.1
MARWTPTTAGRSRSLCAAPPAGPRGRARPPRRPAHPGTMQRRRRDRGRPQGIMRFRTHAHDLPEPRHHSELCGHPDFQGEMGNKFADCFKGAIH